MSNNTNSEVLTNKLFVHFKGNVYQVVDDNVVNENGEVCVLYKRVYPIEEKLPMYIQPKSRFLEVVYRGDKYLRFTEVTPQEVQVIVASGIYPCLIYEENDK